MKNVGQCFHNNPIEEAKLNQGAKGNGVAAFHGVKPDAIVGDGRIFRSPVFVVHCSLWQLEQTHSIEYQVFLNFTYVE
jgi:hypothetical protein